MSLTVSASRSGLDGPGAALIEQDEIYLTAGANLVAIGSQGDGNVAAAPVQVVVAVRDQPICA